VRDDKDREAAMGFDGSWVAHPDLVAICTEAFDKVLGERPNQLERKRPDAVIDASALLSVLPATGGVTEAGLRNNASVALQYLAAWLSGRGAVAIYNLMEDVATAEIARSQLWQWVHAGVSFSDGKKVTAGLVLDVIDQELAAIAANMADSYNSEAFGEARQLLVETALADDFVEFLTIPAYARLP
jgi:malate synthase